MNSFDKIANDYDEDIYPLNTREFVLPTVDILEKLSPGKDVLEFAVGTGRIAIPLSKRGFQLWGMDDSKKMLEVLSKKEGNQNVHIVYGDMSKTKLDKQFDMVYLIFNGITYLLDLEKQVDCFQNAANHLKPGGIFVIETFIPRIDQIVKDDIAPYALEEEYLGFDKYDRINQIVTSYQYNLASKDTESYQTKHRYLWPSELELMGKLTGFELLHKWENWEEEPLTSTSEDCIMVWKKK